MGIEFKKPLIIGDIDASAKEDISEIKQEIGNLEDLETGDKSSIVNAINDALDSTLNGASRDLDNLSDVGNEKLRSLNAYANEGELLHDADGLSFVKNYAHSTFDLSKFTVIGSPVITKDGIASGFSSSNYIKLPALRTTSNSVVEIRGEINTANLPSDAIQDIISSSTAAWFRLVINANRFNLSAGGNDQGFSNAFIEQNKIYFIKILIDNTANKLYIYTSLDKENWTLRMEKNVSVIFTNEVLGIGLNIYSFNRPFSYGSIDLKQFSITVDGVPVFSGNKTGVDTIKPDDYTVEGTPTISADGIASGFSSGNYLIAPISFDKPFKILMSFTTSNTLNASQYLLISPARGLQVYLNISGRLAVKCGTTSWGVDILNYTGSNSLSTNTNYLLELEFTGTKYNVKLNNNLLASVDSISKISTDTNIYIGAYSTESWQGSIDLNSLKIYVDGNLVYQPCLKIPYTLSKTGSKIVNSIYRDRVADMSAQFGFANYYTLQDEPKGNYAVVGSPTISSDFVASGFSTSNYITKDITDLDYSKDFDFISPVATLASNSSQKFFVLDGGTGGGGFRISQHTAQVKFSFKLNSSTTLADYTILSGLVIGDKIQGRVKKVGTDLYLYARKNGGEWVGYANNPITNVATLNATNIICIGWAGSGDQYCWDGSVDLNPYRVFVDNTLLYEAVIEPNFTLPQVELYGLIGQRTLRDSYRNGATYWELWSDRTLEIGGSCTSGVEYNLPKSFASATDYVLSVPYSAKTASSFTPTASGDFIAKGLGVL